MRLLFLCALLAALCALVAADCRVSVTQTLGSTWKQDGVDKSQWSVLLTAGSEAVRSVQLSITGAKIDQLWELELQSNGLYALPQWRLQNGGIPAGQSHPFGYIWESASQATITIASVNCGSPSAAPASPSASPSSLPTIVASPQPSSVPAGCSISATQTARSANNGGSWIEGDFRYQIFDVTVVNTGNGPVAAAQLTIGLAANQEVSQFWNIERSGQSSNTFSLASYYFPLAVGANVGAGYVIKSPLSGSPASPAITVSHVRCTGSQSPSPAAPSPSAVPASPSASPSGTPSPSPVAPSPSAAPASPSPSASPVVIASPQPSPPPAGCSVTTCIVARSASSGGVWQDNGNTYQIFDVTIANNGVRPVNGGVISFSLSDASAAITQFWELSRRGASNDFSILFSYGPLQVDASQGAGIVVRVAGSEPASVPGFAISSLACQ